MKYGKHTDKWYVNKAVKFAEDSVSYPNIPQSVYDKGYFAVEGQLIDYEQRKYWAARKWWLDHEEEFFPVLCSEDESDEYEMAVGLTQHVETLIWKAYPNRDKFRM